MIRAAVFDWGGVLVHVDLHATLSRWDQRLGAPSGSVLNAMFAGTDDTVLVGAVTAEQHWKAVCDALSLSPEHYRQLVNDLQRSEVFDSELAAFVQRLRPRFGTAIMTNQWSDGRALMSRYGAEQLVDELIISAEVGAAKPRPRIYEIALERLGMKPEETIFVDDSVENVHAASEIGLRCVLYEDTPRTIAQVQEILSADDHPASPV